MVDLMGVSGYYATVSMTLNVAQVMLPKARRRRSNSSGAQESDSAAFDGETHEARTDQFP